MKDHKESKEQQAYMGEVMVVEGYSFTDENMAKQARTEAEGVRYVRARTDMSKPDQVFLVYHRLLAQKMFPR